MTFNPRGFVPYRNLSGRLGGTVYTYRTRAENVGHIFKGDLVVLVSAATGTAINPYVVATDATVAGGGIIGVVEGIRDANKKPLVFSQPTRGPYLPTLTDGYIDVNVDPQQTYLACVNGTASAGMAGRYVTVSTTVGGTAMGISPQGVAIDTTTNNIAIVASLAQAPYDAQWPLYCINVEPFEAEVDHDPHVASYKGAHGGKVEVIITNNILGGQNHAVRLVS